MVHIVFSVCISHRLSELLFSRVSVPTVAPRPPIFALFCGTIYQAQAHVPVELISNGVVRLQPLPSTCSHPITRPVNLL